MAHRPSFLDGVLRGTQGGPLPSAEALDDVVGTGPEPGAGGDTTADNVERLIALPPDEYAERPVEIRIVDAGRIRPLEEVVEELRLDGRKRAVATRSSTTLRLEREDDGSLRYDGVGIIAWIREDGSVALRDRSALDPALGPLGGDGLGGRTGLTVEELMPSLENPKLPWLSGTFDLERTLQRVAGNDTHRREKAWFLEHTLALREELRRAHAARGG